MWRIFVRLLGLLSIVGLVLASWHRHDLPLPSELKTEVLSEPSQIETDLPEFQTTRKEVTYSVKPLFEYDLYGLVVSRHDAETWWDRVHKQSNDNLNVLDLCVVWGKNAQTGAYHGSGITYSSGQWTCYVEIKNMQEQQFDLYSLSNNHLLSDDSRLIELIRDTQIGDQIHFHGYLAEYSHNYGFPFKRGSSVTRNDTGNGACETVYVDRFEVVKTGNPYWRKLFVLSLAGLALYLVLWLMLPARRYGYDG